MTRQSIALLVIALFVACAKEHAPAPEASAPPPAGATETTASAPATTSEPAGTGTCALVTVAEVTSVMGHEMKFKESTNPAECVMVSASGDTTKAFNFQVLPGVDAFNAMSSAQGQEAMSGIGEKAVIGKGTNLVVAIKGGRTFIGGAYDASAPATVRDKSIDLAKKAVARM